MPLVRIAEAARQLGCCAATIRRLERDGLFTSTRDRAGARRFSTEDIEALRRILYTDRRSSQAAA